MGTKITPPNISDERELNSIIDNEPSTVCIPGTKKSYKIKWLKHETTRWITRIVLKDGEDEKLSCKMASCIILNDYWKLKFLHWAFWRWLYYVKQYDDGQLLPIIEEGKKKVPQYAYYEATIYAIGMKDTIMTMKKEEVEHFLQEHRGERPTT